MVAIIVKSMQFCQSLAPNKHKVCIGTFQSSLFHSSTILKRKMYAELTGGSMGK